MHFLFVSQSIAVFGLNPPLISLKPLTFTLLFFMILSEDDYLPQRHKMQLRTREFRMFLIIFAKCAVEDLKFI